MDPRLVHRLNLLHAKRELFTRFELLILRNPWLWLLVHLGSDSIICGKGTLELLLSLLHGAVEAILRVVKLAAPVVGLEARSRLVEARLRAGLLERVAHEKALLEEITLEVARLVPAIEVSIVDGEHRCVTVATAVAFIRRGGRSRSLATMARSWLTLLLL